VYVYRRRWFWRSLRSYLRWWVLAWVPAVILAFPVWGLMEVHSFFLNLAAVCLAILVMSALLSEGARRSRHQAYLRMRSERAVMSRAADAPHIPVPPPAVPPWEDTGRREF
jgi:hypothetical protein